MVDLLPGANSVKEIWLAQGIQSILAIPLVLHENLVGYCGLSAERFEKTWNEEDNNLQKKIGEIFSSVIARQRGEAALKKIEESFKQVAQENAIIAEIGRIVSSTLNIDEVYQLFVNELAKILPFDRLAVATGNFPEGTLHIPFVAGPEIEGRKKGDVISLSGSIVEHVIETRSGVLIDGKNIGEYVERFPALAPVFQSGFLSMMVVPLVSKKEVLGVLNVQSARADAYAPMNLTLLGKVGFQIAGAIANALGIQDFVLKPFDMNLLARVTRRAIDHKKNLGAKPSQT